MLGGGDLKDRIQQLLRERAGLAGGIDRPADFQLTIAKRSLNLFDPLPDQTLETDRHDRKHSHLQFHWIALP